MPRQFTLEQVAAHNQSHPNNKYAVILGEVYRIASIPFGNCKICASHPSTIKPSEFHCEHLSLEHSFRRVTHRGTRAKA